MTTTVNLEQNPAVVRRDWVPDFHALVSAQPVA